MTAGDQSAFMTHNDTIKMSIPGRLRLGARLKTVIVTRGGDFLNFSPTSLWVRWCSVSPFNFNSRSPNSGKSLQ